MTFLRCHRLENDVAPSDACLVFHGDRLLARVADGQRLEVPPFHAITALAESPCALTALGTLAESPCWTIALAAETAPPAGWEWLEIRPLMPILTPHLLHAISSARQLHWWKTCHRFCGKCGTVLEDAQDETARKCPGCGTAFFPSSAPAVIVAVTKGSQILLAHNSHFSPTLFSVIAGFVDPGETLENTVAREVREEVGLEVKDIRYVASQPWPFPNSLMLAFTAEYAAGEVRVDGQEIEKADWFSAKNLPEIPRKGTVARLLIDRWLSANT